MILQPDEAAKYSVTLAVRSQRIIATANVDVWPTPFGLDIIDEHGAQVAVGGVGPTDPGQAKSTCSAPLESGSHTYVGRIITIGPEPTNTPSGKPVATSAPMTAVGTSPTPTPAPAPTPTPTPGGAGPSGVPMPTTAPAGWAINFAEDFVTDLGKGSWPGSYSAAFVNENNGEHTTNNGVGEYETGILSVSDSCLVAALSTVNGVPQCMSIRPVIASVGPWDGTIYGRIDIMMKCDPGLSGFKIAAMYWPTDNNWNEGELDWPEGDLSSNVQGFVHQVGNPSNNISSVSTGAKFTDWHCYSKVWTNGNVTYLLDGVEVLSYSGTVPSTNMTAVLQLENDIGVTPNPSVAGNVYFDWVVEYALAS